MRMELGTLRVIVLIAAVLLVAGAVLDHAPAVTGLITGQYELTPDFSHPNNMVSNSDACRDAGEGCLWDQQKFTCVCKG